MNNAMIIDEKDNVAVAIETIEKDMEVVYPDKKGQTCSLKALTDIQIYHKLAIKDIKKGDPVVKYGEHIGLAAVDIKAGEHVHEHNVESHRENL